MMYVRRAVVPRLIVELCDEQMYIYIGEYYIGGNFNTTL